MPITDHPQLAPYAALIEDCAADYALDPLIIAAIILIESSGNPSAFNEVSKATGLMGVVAREGGISGRPTIVELMSPRINIDEGCRILAEYRTREDGDVERVLMRYGGYANRTWEEFQGEYMSRVRAEVGKLVYGQEAKGLA